MKRTIKLFSFLFCLIFSSVTSWSQETKGQELNAIAQKYMVIRQTSQEYTEKILQSLEELIPRNRIQISRMELELDFSEMKQNPNVRKYNIAVNIDGIWHRELDPITGELRKTPAGGYVRKYTPLAQEELDAAENLVKQEIGFDPSRGDKLKITNMQFDRTFEFEKEDDELRHAEESMVNLLLMFLKMM